MIITIFALLPTVCADIPNMLFYDNFDTPEINWKSRDVAFPTGLQEFRQKAVAQPNGTLTITADKNIGTRTRAFVSGVAYYDQPFKYGTISVVAKVARSQAVWSAVYLIDALCIPGEECAFYPPAMSVLDFKGQLPCTYTAAGSYRVGGGPLQWFGLTVGDNVDLTEGFHVYSLSWTSSELKWYLDGRVVYWVTDAVKIPQVPMILALRVDVGGNFGGPVTNDTQLPSTFTVKRVEVYSMVEGSLMTVETVVPTILIIIILVVGLLALVKNGWRWEKRSIYKNEKDCIGSSRVLPNTELATFIDDAWKKYLVNQANADGGLAAYIEEISIDSSCLKFDDVVLGRGQFGVVRLARLQTTSAVPAKLVAIKSLRSLPQFQADSQPFFDEMRTLALIGKHPNIVNLVGVIMQEQKLIMEYCSSGSLLEYLRSQKDSFVHFHVSPDEQQVAGNDCLNNLAGTHDPRVLTTSDRIDICRQIASAMEYLVSRNVIHCDLAARNVLVCENLAVKISDFGMARQREELYVQLCNTVLPLKWMAPESIVDKICTAKSDIWSFGVVMWEVFSHGSVPYMDVKLPVFCAGDGHSQARALLEFLQNEQRLTRTTDCPSVMYDLMITCWEWEANNRPAFCVLREELISMTAVDTGVGVSEPYLNMRLVYD